MNMKMLRTNAAVLPLQCPPSPNSALLLFCKTRSSFTSFSYGSLPIKQKLPKSFITDTAVKCAASDNGAGALGEDLRQQYQEEEKGRGNFWEKWKSNTAEMSGKLAKLGLAAVLAYGLFDGVTYTTFFVLAFLGYEKSTGKNPAANLQALLGIVVLMWTGNNVTRPFRVAGAAALAPAIDKGLRRIQKAFNFPNLVYSFALVVSVIATLCFTVVGLLILSRWGK